MLAYMLQSKAGRVVAAALIPPEERGHDNLQKLRAEAAKVDLTVAVRCVDPGMRSLFVWIELEHEEREEKAAIESTPSGCQLCTEDDCEGCALRGM